MSAIPLADALLYLRIDDASPLVDQEIQSMLDAAEQFISRKTGHYFSLRIGSITRAEMDA